MACVAHCPKAIAFSCQAARSLPHKSDAYQAERRSVAAGGTTFCRGARFIDNAEVNPWLENTCHIALQCGQSCGIAITLTLGEALAAVVVLKSSPLYLQKLGHINRIQALPTPAVDS